MAAIPFNTMRLRLVAGTLLFCLKSIGHEETRPFVDLVHHFSIRVPSGWSECSSRSILEVRYTPDRPKRGIAAFYNAVLLPYGGAVIQVLERKSRGIRFRSSSPEDWASFELKWADQTTSWRGDYEAPAESEIRSAIETSFDTPTRGEGLQPLTHVNIYLRFRSEVFAAHLFYNAHDPRGAEYREVFHAVIGSWRPL
jgi:hypothetical protein